MEHAFVGYAGRLFCNFDDIEENIASGDTWTASSRGECLDTKITAEIVVPDGNWPRGAQAHDVACAPYASSGTGHSIFSILMKGDNACCVLSSHETQKCP